MLCVIGEAAGSPLTGIFVLGSVFPSSFMPPSTKRSRNSASLDAESKQEPLALKPAGLTCPFPDCRRTRTTWSGLRTHLKDLHPGWDPPADWMEVSGCKACPSCGHGVVTLSTAHCSDCPDVKSKGPAKMAHLPSIAIRTDVAQVSLQTGSSAPAPDWTGFSGSCEVKVSSVYDPQLMAICFTNAPLIRAAFFARL